MTISARLYVAAGFAMLIAAPANANDWEKFYHSFGVDENCLPSTTGPEVAITSSSPEDLIRVMWERGYDIIGYSAFSSPNGKTSDATKLAKKLRARYVTLSTNLTSSQTVAIPLTTNVLSNSSTSGSSSLVTNAGLSASGTYTGNTVTYTPQTTYTPIQVNRFDKFAAYFQERKRKGSGLLYRMLTPDEVSRFETQKAFVIRAVREGSPAYNADFLPGDVILKVNGKPATPDSWKAGLMAGEATILVNRSGGVRTVKIALPPEWR